ncbi:para-aminobenzoate synthase component II [Salmonella enterica subsp. arizonae]|uniref:Para-aminobenzoate synthase component II n=1 Tax=Salmonella enterica subsp. arizonae TaxID=59203 RepID=A0A2X4SYK8_SALER|nr:para-aminobenzoate synthase component II [Salmonella enterica subsp. arizonae]
MPDVFRCWRLSWASGDGAGFWRDGGAGSERMHGKTSPITHNGQGVFRGLPCPLTVTRYHSLIVDPATLPECFEITAWSGMQEIMGIRHREWIWKACSFTRKVFSANRDTLYWKIFYGVDL